MFEEIYIIDCENELVMMLREKFEEEKLFRFKNIFFLLKKNQLNLSWRRFF